MLKAMSARQSLERYFEFERLGTSWRTEILAGFTTFLTMAYIVFVNPSILSQAGVPFAGAMAATCLSAAAGSMVMGAWARYPIAMAPGMGLNAYFTYSVVKGMGIAWPVALGAVFLSGIAFLLLTALGVRQLIAGALPPALYAAVAVGIGLLIALIGLRNGGVVVASPATLLTLGDLRRPEPLLCLFGLLLMAVLTARRVQGALLIGVLAATGIGLWTGVTRWSPQPSAWQGLALTAGRLDIPGALHLGALEIILVFLFVDLFDNLGTLVAVGKRAGLFDEVQHAPRLTRILTADGLATTVGAWTGTSTVVSYIESTAGVVAGGRSGVTSIVVGLLFLASLVLAPLVGVVPAAATAPALVLVGVWMMSHASEIPWQDPLLAVPSFLTAVMIPLSFSIANGLAFGFSAYTLLQVAAGRGRHVSWLVYLLTALFLLRFAYMGAG